jgi:ribose 5-phosphate isomerase B
VRIHIGSDHAGLEFKARIIDHLKQNGNDVTDHGPFEYDAQDDYPVFCIPTAQAVAKDPNSFGIVLGGSGNGEQMAANKVKGVRAALVWSIETAKELVDTFLATPFSNDERHIRRINQISTYEGSN